MHSAKSFLIIDHTIRFQETATKELYFEQLTHGQYPHYCYDFKRTLKLYEDSVRSSMTQELFKNPVTGILDYALVIDGFRRILESESSELALQGYEDSAFSQVKSIYYSQKKYVRQIKVKKNYFSKIEHGRLAVFNYLKPHGELSKRFVKINKVEDRFFSGVTPDGYRSFLKERIEGNVLRSLYPFNNEVTKPFTYRVTVNTVRDGLANVTLESSSTGDKNFLNDSFKNKFLQK